MRTNRYIVKSLELHLFFGRIMKEHALFLRTGFTPANVTCEVKAEQFMHEFETLLSEAVTLSDGIVSKDVLQSGEIVTDFTTLAEKQTERFTCIRINGEITQQELCLTAGEAVCGYPAELHRKVRQLNRRALSLLDGLITLKENILSDVLSCKMFTMNYPLLIEHITREAKLYRRYVQILESEGDLNVRSMKETECFWNQIMMEHAQFIRGLLDPCEIELMDAADEFAKRYCKLLEASRNAHEKAMTAAALEETRKFRDYKAAGTEGIQQCTIRSVILPLLADHVLREANHYLRLLQR